MKKCFWFLLLIFLSLDLQGDLVCAQNTENKELFVQRALNEYEKGGEDETIATADIFMNETEPLSEDAESSSFSNVAAQGDFIIDVVDFQNKNMMDVLNELQEKSGLTFITPSIIKGEVSLSLQKINVLDLLRVILEPYGLAFIKKDGAVNILSQQDFEMEQGHKFTSSICSRSIPFLHIDKEDLLPKLNTLKSSEGKIFLDLRQNKVIIIDKPEFVSKMEDLIKNVDVPLETEIFQLHYVRIPDVKEDISKMLTPAVGYIDFDERANKMVVTDTLSAIETISSYIKRLDKKVNVVLGIKVYQICLNEAHQDGVDWEAIVSDYQKINLSLKNSPDRNIPLSIGTITDEDYVVLLEALDTVGEVSVLKEMEVSGVVNSGVDIKIDTETSWGSKDVDIEMQVIPFLEKAKGMMLDIQPAMQWSLNDQISPETIESRIFYSQEDKKVAVGQNEIVVLGGARREREVSKIRKFPFLGHLPVVGFVFRKQDKFFEKAEYVVFITPKVLPSESTPF